MEHPFINKSDLSNKSLEELQETLSSLTTKINFAMASGNQPLLNQLRMAVTSYQAQHKKKLDEVFAKQDLGNNIHVDGDKK
jgi:hypothetical protein